MILPAQGKTMDEDKPTSRGWLGYVLAILLLVLLALLLPLGCLLSLSPRPGCPPSFFCLSPARFCLSPAR